MLLLGEACRPRSPATAAQNTRLFMLFAQKTIILARNRYPDAKTRTSAANRSERNRLRVNLAPGGTIVPPGPEGDADVQYALVLLCPGDGWVRFSGTPSPACSSFGGGRFPDASDAWARRRKTGSCTAEFAAPVRPSMLSGSASMHSTRRGKKWRMCSRKSKPG